MKVRSTKHIKKLIRSLDLDIDTEINADKMILNELLEAQEKSKKRLSTRNVWRNILGSRAGSLAAAFLIISSLTACFVLSQKNANLKDELEIARRDIAATPIDDSVTINFYLREHQDFIAQKASLNSATSQSLQMRVSLHDVLYYEIFDEQPEYMSPGIIVRGPLSQRQISLPESPVISNGHTLTLSEARQTADFELASPSWIRPSYRLDQIKKIEARDALQLLYTDGINSISLFEQPLDGQRRLEPKDFREYAVYSNQGQGGGTILAWKDETLSYVLIGNIEISQLMDMAQSISARK